jgi:hypothetical protein
VIKDVFEEIDGFENEKTNFKYDDNQFYDADRNYGASNQR